MITTKLFYCLFQYKVHFEYYLQMHSLSWFSEGIKVIEYNFYSHGTSHTVTLIR